MGCTSSLGGRKQAMQTELSRETSCPACDTTFHTEWFTLHHTFIRKTTVLQENYIIEVFNRKWWHKIQRTKLKFYLYSFNEPFHSSRCMQTWQRSKSALLHNRKLTYRIIFFHSFALKGLKRITLFYNIHPVQWDIFILWNQQFAHTKYI
jgi:hypothetical protein